MQSTVTDHHARSIIPIIKIAGIGSSEYFGSLGQAVRVLLQLLIPSSLSRFSLPAFTTALDDSYGN